MPLLLLLRGIVSVGLMHRIGTIHPMLSPGCSALFVCELGFHALSHRGRRYTPTCLSRFLLVLPLVLVGYCLVMMGCSPVILESSAPTVLESLRDAVPLLPSIFLEPSFCLCCSVIWKSVFSSL